MLDSMYFFIFFSVYFMFSFQWFSKCLLYNESMVWAVREANLNCDSRLEAKKTQTFLVVYVKKLKKNRISAKIIYGVKREWCGEGGVALTLKWANYNVHCQLNAIRADTTEHPRQARSIVRGRWCYYLIVLLLSCGCCFAFTVTHTRILLSSFWWMVNNLSQGNSNYCIHLWKQFCIDFS